MMTRRTLVSAAASVMALMSLSAQRAAVQRDITLPRDTPVYRASDLPGYALVQRNCIACHSAHYVAMQPPSSARGYWDATVKKMKKPFGATFADEEIPAMVDYLVKTYGGERPDAFAPKGPRPGQASPSREIPPLRPRPGRYLRHQASGL